MAERRMLAKSIIKSDAFSNMPPEAQMLYVRLNMESDDDGFCDNPRSIMRECGASEDSMKLLIAKKFVITFTKNDGFIVVIKHWRMNNFIRKDTYHETRYKEFMRELYYDENRSYSLNPGDGHVPCIPGNSIPAVSGTSQQCYEPVTDTLTDASRDVNETDTQVRLDKDRVGKDRVVESREDKNNNILSTSTSVRGKGESEGENPTDGLTDAEKESLNAYYGKSVGSYMRLGYDYDIILDLAEKKGADRDKVLEIARGGKLDDS